MLNEPTCATLRNMKLSAMAAEFMNQMSDPEIYAKLGFEERFGLLVDAEWNLPRLTGYSGI